MAGTYYARASTATVGLPAPPAAWVSRVAAGMLVLVALCACDAGTAPRRAADRDSAEPQRGRPRATAARRESSSVDDPAAAAIDGSDADVAGVDAPDATSAGQAGGNAARSAEPQESGRVSKSSADAAQPAAEGDEELPGLVFGALLIDAAPVAERQLSPALEAALDRARAAMRERDFLDARQQLQAAAGERTSDADRLAYEELILIHALWAQGWNEVGISARSLAAGDTLGTWAGPAHVQEKTETEIVLRVDGQPQAFAARTSEMDVRLAAALLARRATARGLGLDPHIVTLFVMDRGGTREAAREACVEALQRGAYIDPLIAELRRRKWDEAERAEEN